MHQRKLLNSLDRWREQDELRAESTGEQREDVGSFLEVTGWNKKALSYVRALDKMTPDKRDDVLRSFDDMRAILEDRWRGANTPDMLDNMDQPQPAEDHGPVSDDIREDQEDFDRHLAGVYTGDVPRDAA